MSKEIEQIYHYTVATGDGRWSPRSEVSDDTIKVIRGALESVPISSSGLGLPHFVVREPWCLWQPQWRHRALTYAVGAFARPLVWCWLILPYSNIAAAWSEVQRIADVAEVLCRPTCPELPCLAVVPGLIAANLDVPLEIWSAIGDFERCVAWTLLET